MHCLFHGDVQKRKKKKKLSKWKAITATALTNEELRKCERAVLPFDNKAPKLTWEFNQQTLLHSAKCSTEKGLASECNQEKQPCSTVHCLMTKSWNKELQIVFFSQSARGPLCPNQIRFPSGWSLTSRLLKHGSQPVKTAQTQTRCQASAACSNHFIHKFRT